MTNFTSTAANESLEDRIFQRLQVWQEQHRAEVDALESYRKLSREERENRDVPSQPPRDSKLESDIYHFLYRELKGIATVLPGLGGRAVQPNIDVSCRFTSVLNKAFLRIIERYPDKLMQATSRSHLTGYVSKAMSRMMLNHYKSKGTFRSIVEKLGLTETEDAQVRDILSHLSEEKAQHFEKRTSVSFARGLELIRRWDESSDADENARAQVLRLRYVDGLGYDDIAAEMNIDKDAVENLLEQAKYHLRKLKS